MSEQPPKIDKRTYPEIVAQTEQLAQEFTPWRPLPNGKPDAGRALIRIFGRMAAMVSDRLNQVPEKNFLAFLDAIGTQMLPPQPARVPITFKLVPGSPPDALVPAGTQIAAPPAAEGEEEVIFETERDLALVNVQLQAVFSRDPGADQYSDRTPQATDQLDAAFKIFEGETPIEHYVYLARDDIFALPENKTVIIIVYSTQAAELAQLPLTWSYWDGITWVLLQPTIFVQDKNRLEAAITNFTAPARTTINGVEAAWVRIGLNGPAPKTLPFIDAILTGMEIRRNTLMPLDSCYFNSALLDLSRDFYPLGQQPRFNDTFYLASKEAFAKPRATVTLDVKLSGLPVNKNGGAEIAWEAYNGSTWERLGQSSVTNPRISGVFDFNDATLALTQEGLITLTLPSQIQPATVNGVTTYWVRARLVKGNYGVEATFNQTTNASNQIVIQPVPASFAAPSLQSIRMRYSYQSRDIPLSACQTYNDFIYSDRTYELLNDGSNFQPFTRSTDTRPTLYLGFDRPFPNRTISLYLQVEPPLPGEIASGNSVTQPAQIIYEYSAPGGWGPLAVKDETDAFSDRGLIRFIAPLDAAPRSEFGQSLYWLRVRWESGEFHVPPRWRRLLTNTVWASQAMAIAVEGLGSSDGKPAQIYRTAQVPVLLGQRLEVFEIGELPLVEKAAVERLEGKRAISATRDRQGQIEGYWVTWHEVPDFYGSDQRDRHYVIDRVKGEIYFGDGLRGMIPPPGFNNIRLAPYRTGGGHRGNCPALTITELKTTVPYVESAANLEPATGGADQESTDRIKERGPKALRHRGRAVTVEDIEDLAMEASTEVARALAIAPNFDPIDGLDWLPIYRLNLNGPGNIQVELNNFPDGLILQAKISGPGQSNPYLSQQLTQSNPTATYTVTAAQFAAGQEWNITFTNSGEPSNNVRVKITYPTGSLDTEFPAPSTLSERSSNPYRGVGDAGKVLLVIVPNSPNRQPTPSLGLMERVENYLRDRCPPAMNLQITEPDWVEVTVNVNLVPLSLDRADEIKQAATNALVKFLHPLTGGAKGQGWDFGRQPHLSDLYGILEKVEGVDYVESLTVDSPSLDELPADRKDRFLIYSGAHQVNLILPARGG